MTTTTSDNQPYLQIQGLVKKFGDNYAVDHIDLNINKNGRTLPVWLLTTVPSI